MCNSTQLVEMGFCEQQFPAGTHICLVFRDERERRNIVSKFVSGGLGHGERVLYFADVASPAEVADWLTKLDVDVQASVDTGAMSIDEATQVYCPNGSFQPDLMCANVATAYQVACAEGYPFSRVTGEMTWALRGLPGSERLMEYEAAVNAVLQLNPITAMCQYDANRFSGEMIFKALQVHPYMVMNRQLVRNPYFAV